MYHTVAITGSNGFIGRALTDYFLTQNKFVRGIDFRDRLEAVLNSEGFSQVRHNVLDSEFKSKINLRQTSGLIHLAGKAEVVVARDQEQELEKYNLDLMAKALEICYEFEIPCMINASTSCVYGKAPTPFKVHGTLDPLGAYGRSKLKAEELATTVAKDLGIRVFSFRLFNVIGKYQRRTQLPWVALEAAAGMRSPISLYGICFRAYTYVDDFARICSHVLENYRSFSPGHYVFNFGGPESISQLRLFSKIEELTRVVVPYVMGERRQGEMLRTLPDMSLTESTLGKFVSENSIELGVKDVITSFEAYQNSFPN